MRAHYLQHVPFEGLGSIGPWLTQNGYELTVTPFFDSTALPDPQSLDFLIIMGGPMSANDEDRCPWLRIEKQFIRSVIETNKPVLGICLGAQLIASAMGARVYPSPVKEIGWFPIHAVGPAPQSTFQFPSTETVFHWHGETFDLPKGAIPLARSEGCEHQAFQLGSRAIGLQFHLETTPELARALVENCRDELVSAPYIQCAEEIVAMAPSHYRAINDRMEQVLSFLHSAADNS